MFFRVLVYVNDIWNYYGCMWRKIFGVVEVDIYVFDYLCKIFFEMLFIFCNL